MILIKTVKSAYYLNTLFSLKAHQSKFFLHCLVKYIVM